MRRKLLFILAGILVIGFFIIIVRTIIVIRTPNQGVLKVAANTRVRVFLENREVGKTPLETKVGVGDYTIKLIPDTTDTVFSTWQGRVKIGQNILTYINRDLSDSELTSAGEMLWLEKSIGNKAELSVISVPDGASVVLDDQSKGVTPISLTDLTAGDHTLVVTSPGFEPRTVKIKLTTGYKLNASVSLALSPSQISVAETAEAQPSATVSATVSTSPTPGLSTPTPTPSTAKNQPPQKPKKIKISATPTGFLRVRSEASTAADEIARVKPEEIYPVLDIQLEGTIIRWYKIDLGEKSGWVSAEYAQKSE